MPVEGGCRCGAVRYTLALEAMPPAYACHCHQCQRWSGSAFSLNLLVPEVALSVAGPVAMFAKTTSDAAGERTSTQRFCADCHARLYNTNTRRAGVAVIRAGTLDRSEELNCVGHIFTASRQRWLTLPDDVPSWPEAAPPAEFIALLRPGA